MVATARTPEVRSTTKTAIAEEPVAGLTRAPFPRSISVQSHPLYLSDFLLIKVDAVAQVPMQAAVYMC